MKKPTSTSKAWLNHKTITWSQAAKLLHEINQVNNPGTLDFVGSFVDIGGVVYFGLSMDATSMIGGKKLYEKN